MTKIEFVGARLMFNPILWNSSRIMYLYVAKTKAHLYFSHFITRGYLCCHCAARKLRRNHLNHLLSSFLAEPNSRSLFPLPRRKVRYTFLFVHQQCDYWGKRFEYIILLGMKDIDSQKPYMYGARTTGPYFRLMPVLLMIVKRDLLQDCRTEYK